LVHRVNVCIFQPTTTCSYIACSFVIVFIKEHVGKSIKLNMKSQISRIAPRKATLIKSVSVGLCLMLGIYFTIFSIQPSIGSCSQSDFAVQTDENGLPVSIQCSRKGNEVSWLAWITNKSTSNQFHFLDLLELLSQIGSDE
jgi:hypothetical protein